MCWINLYTSFGIPSEAKRVNELGFLLLEAILTGFVECVRPVLNCSSVVVYVTLLVGIWLVTQYFSEDLRDDSKIN